MNPLLPGHSGTAPEPTRNTTRNNQGTNEDGSQTDPHPEASLFHGQREQNSGTGNDYDKRFEKSHYFSSILLQIGQKTISLAVAWTNLPKWRERNWQTSGRKTSEMA